MKKYIELSSDEIRILDTIFIELNRKAKYSMTLNQLLQEWNDFVTQVEIGYSLTIYDYTNDLSIRDILQENILLKVPHPLAEKIKNILEPMDERFNQATKKCIKSLQPQTNFSWWFRIPKNLVGELKKDLESEGII